jgi:hypothetical protein
LVSSFGAATGIGKNRARAANAKDWECIPISKSVTQLRSSTERGKRVIESSKNQENMVGVPKHSSLTLTVTFGHLSLRQSEPFLRGRFASLRFGPAISHSAYAFVVVNNL